MFGDNAPATVLIRRFSRTGDSRASLSSALELVSQYTGLPSKNPYFWTGFNAWPADSSSLVTELEQRSRNKRHPAQQTSSQANNAASRLSKQIAQGDPPC
jgi:hypothetical protein